MHRRRPLAVDSLLGTGIADRLARRRCTFAFATDLKLPHIWDIALEFVDADASGHDDASSGCSAAALFTLRNAAIGFALGSLLGLGARDRARPRRGCSSGRSCRIIVASQTIPIIAIAPLIVVGLKADWFGVAIVVDLPDVLPGDDRRAARPARVRPAGARADALVRRVARRDPAQAAAAGVARRTCSPGSGSPRRRRSSARSSASCRRCIQDGLARQIITGMQYYSLNAEYLWATIVMSSVLGIGVYLLVAGVESVGAPPRARVDRWSAHDGRAPTGRPPARHRPSSRSRASRRSSTPAARATGRVEALVGIDLTDRAPASSSR